MTNPTLGWTFTGPLTFTIAGINPTVAETLAGIKAFIDAHATKWMVSDYSAVNGTLEIKRNPSVGTVTGELATVRMLLMGGQVPHANCLAGSHTAGANTGLYGALSVDANTTGPAASYASGAPYSTKYTRAGRICVPSTDLTTASNPRITLFESDDVFVITLSDNTNTASWAAGRMIVRASDDSLIWACMPNGVATALTATGSSFASASAGFCLTPLSTASSQIKATYWDTATASARLFGRLYAPIMSTVDTGLGSAGSSGAFMPVHVGESTQATSQAPNFLGTLRQFRFGPVAGHVNQLTVSAVVKGTHVFGGVGTGIGMWLDEAA